jgi:DNA-binding beta-propeller fold protein YncE
MRAEGAGKTIVGSGRFVYEASNEWQRLPQGWELVEVAGVATDSQGRAYVFNRGVHPVIVFDSDGTFLRSWGEGGFVRPHGITIGPGDFVYLVDDQDHTVRKYTRDGELVWTLGTSGQGSLTGVQRSDYRTISRAGPPFNQPTNVALAPTGELYVSDGYGNARIHKFSADGRLLLSWGEPGGGPRQFRVPHGIAVDGEGRVFVADRENSRLQLFDPDGGFIAEWTDVVRPCEVFVDAEDNVFVAELGRRAGLYPWMTADLGSPGGRLSVFDRTGALLSRWGGGDRPGHAGDFFAPHDVWLDAHGNLYVGEVTWSAGGNRGLVPRDCPCLQKFVRRALGEDGLS